MAFVALRDRYNIPTLYPILRKKYNGDFPKCHQILHSEMALFMIKNFELQNLRK